MQKILVALCALLLLTPVLASADSLFGVEPTLGQLLSRVAAIQSMEKGNAIGCAVAVTKSTVRAGELFTIGWGSYGADQSYSTDPQNAYTQNGQQAMMIDHPEARVYHFTFFGPNGLKTTCDQTISVLPRV